MHDEALVWSKVEKRSPNVADFLGNIETWRRLVLPTIPTSPTNPTTCSDQWIADLVSKLDTAMSAPNDQERCNQIKGALSEHIGNGDCPLDADLLASVASQYGRRLLYKDPEGVYTVVLMIWGANQVTPLHDHAGVWCVDCVCLGNITVESYEPQPSRTDGSGLYDFEKAATIKAGMGEAGALISPFEYHTIHNHANETAATIHVYGDELTECNVFVPQDSGYRLEVLQLGYSD